MNILFTCAGRRTYLLKYFKENLDCGDKIIATDMQLTAPALQLADIKLQVPNVYDSLYVDEILSICRKYSVKAVFSLNDLELPILSANKALFKEIGVSVIVSSQNVIDICFDKYKTHQYVESIGLKSPVTFVDLNEAKVALAKKELHYPLVLKPRWGSGSIGIEFVYDEEDLDITYCLLLKKIRRSILNNASVDDKCILIQEKIQGNEYGLDVMNDLEGNNVGVSVKHKLAMRAGETDKAITEKNEEVYKIGKILGENLKHIGNLDVDVMQRSEKDYCVLELNPRFGGGFPFSYEAGVNFPKAIISWLKGETVDHSILKPEIGKMFAKNDFLMEIK